MLNRRCQCIGQKTEHGTVKTLPGSDKKGQPVRELEKEQMESSEDSCIVLVSQSLKDVLQVILEQHGLELHGPLTQGHCSAGHTTVLAGLWLVESWDVD